MIISAQELTRTRLCRAHLCTQEADPYTRFCHRCNKNPNVRLHVAPAPVEDTLRCATCGNWKPDPAFPLLSEARLKHAGGRPSARRGRYYSCNTCEARRKRNAKAKP